MPDSQADLSLSRRKAQDVLAVLSPAVRQELESELTLVVLASGEILFREGDEGDALYFLQSGRLAVTVQGVDGKELLLDDLAPGAIVGEMALVTGQSRSATVRAREETRLARLSRDAFDRLTTRNPSDFARLGGAMRERVQRRQAIAILKDWLGPTDPDTFAEIFAGTTWQHLASGATLFRQGDPADALYLVLDGRLRIVESGRDGRERNLGEVRRGESVGEFAVITGAPRSATVQAQRETALLRIPSSLVASHPVILGPIARTAALRAQRRGAYSSESRDDPMVLTILPAGPGLPTADFAAKLAAELARWGSTLHLDSRRLDAAFGRPGAAQAPDTRGLGLTLGGWLKEQEGKHQFVLYQADEGDSEWTRRAAARADKLIILADASHDPALSTVERAAVAALAHTPTELVLLQGDRTPHGSLAWLAPRRLNAHHHVRPDFAADLARLARRLAGRALGVVLSGGGARGFAHIGLLRALEEKAMPIDFIGGTSIGALIAAAYAMHGSAAACAEAAASFGQPRLLIDYTLPLVALTASRGVTRVFQHVFGEARIEDFAIPFFCVSTNLTRAAPLVHERGEAWRAIRASSAIPGVFTPVLHDGDLLVDGGVMNNLPVDLMRERVGPGSVIASSASPREEQPPAYSFGESLSGWRLLWTRLRRRQDLLAPSIVSTLARATSVSSQYFATTVSETADLVVQHRTANFGLLRFDQHQALIELGYREAMTALEEWQASSGEARVGAQALETA